VSVTIERVSHPDAAQDVFLTASSSRLSPKPTRAPRWAVIGLVGLRLAIGFEFLWAFFDKTFGLGYATPAAHAWINGGSPTKGFLSGAIGPFQGVFNAIAGAPVVDWLFMLGLLGVGVALILGVAVRAGAVSGALMLALMYLAVWVPSTTAGGQPSGSTNPIVDEHIVGIFGLILIAALVTGVPDTWAGRGPHCRLSRGTAGCAEEPSTWVSPGRHWEPLPVASSRCLP
jgi:thiosulfate dehydrogenase [quinone] large subunit